MAKLYITEFTGLGDARGLSIEAALEPGYDQPPVDISGTSAQSETFKNGTRIIRVHTDIGCSITFGADPTATTDNRRLAIDATEYFAIGSASNLKLAVIQNG